MPWNKIPKKDISAWNEKLKQTDALFCQFPYYVASEYRSLLSKAVFINHTHENQETAFAAIIEIGFYPFKVGIIESGPVLLQNNVNTEQIIEDLKEYARSKSYLHLQIRPSYNASLNQVFKQDQAFEENIYFPFHRKTEFDWNIYNKPEEELLAGFKMQCRRKLVLAGRVPYKFLKVEDDKTLKDISQLFKAVSNTKGYGFLPFKIYQSIYKEGKKFNLCDFYVAYLGNDLVNVVLVVKDGQSFYHYTSALIIKGYKANESPPVKLHFFIMQDCFYNEHKPYYNISFGGSDNLIRFKELFNPVEIEKPPYYTFLVRRKSLNLLTKFSQRQIIILRRLFKSIDNFFAKKIV
jgi:hypothetical protein